MVIKDEMSDKKMVNAAGVKSDERTQNSPGRQVVDIERKGYCRYDFSLKIE